MIKLEIYSYKIFSYFYFLMVIIGVVAFIFVSLFLYKNFYQTITQSQEVLILRREVAIEDIDMDKFDAIIKKIKEKTRLRRLNIFIRF